MTDFRLSNVLGLCLQMTMEAVCILKQEKADWDTVSYSACGHGCSRCLCIFDQHAAHRLYDARCLPCNAQCDIGCMTCNISQPFVPTTKGCLS